jgi:Ca-activated chloride channel family protein
MSLVEYTHKIKTNEVYQMNKLKNLLCLGLSLVLILISIPATTVLADELSEDNQDQTLAPYFFIEDGDPSVDKFPLKETDVKTNINGIIAETYVTQVYENDGKNPINARYVFPCSTKVAVHGMTMQIGNEIIKAKIKECEEAEEEFEEAKSEGKSASLLEEDRPNVFTMNVANIMPGDTIKIELHYTETISSTDGKYEFVFPTVVGPRYASPTTDTSGENNDFVETPYIMDGDTPPGKYNITVNLTSAVPISEITSTSHKITTDIENNNALITLSNPEKYAGDRDFVLHYSLTGKEISSGLMLNNGGIAEENGTKENFFMLTVQPPERFTADDILPREYIFLVDVSGSMYGYPIDTAKSLVKDLVNNLRPTDTFNVVLFSGISAQMSPKSVPANDNNIKLAMDLIDDEEGCGGTELAPALQSAIDIPRADKNVARSIIVITDGYVSEESSIFDIINKNIGETDFFSFGIGDGVNRYLVEGIAKAGQGEAFIVENSAKATEVAKSFREYIQSPILRNVKVNFNGFKTYDVEPQKLATLFAKKPIILYGKWKGEPTGTIEITGTRGNGEAYKQVLNVADIQSQGNNSALPYLWARSRVEQLMDYGIAMDEDTIERVRKEVTQIGLDYSMLTQFTSFIAVTEEVRNTGNSAKDVDQPLPLPHNVSNFSIGSYTSGSEPGTVAMIVIAIFMAMIGVMRLLKKQKRVV